MMRRLLLDVLLFLMPFALYGIYWRLNGRSDRKHPWSLLFVSGLVLVAGSFVWWGISESHTPNGVYVPPHVENGAVVPGHVEPPR